MKAFITGSRAYGTPTEKSDLDLVILTDEATKYDLEKFSDEEGVIRFGKLNIIATTDALEYSVWKVGTVAMKKSEKKYSKEEAKEFLDVYREAVGIKDNYKELVEAFHSRKKIKKKKNRL